jgi:tRNA 2-thiouridine synthesizing protein A
MDPIRVDAMGLRCPQPILKLAVVIIDHPKGTIIEMVADCPTFEKDIRAWCERRKLTVLSVRGEGATKTVQVQI